MGDLSSVSPAGCFCHSPLRYTATGMYHHHSDTQPQACIITTPIHRHRHVSSPAKFAHTQAQACNHHHSHTQAQACIITTSIHSHRHVSSPLPYKTTCMSLRTPEQNQMNLSVTTPVQNQMGVHCAAPVPDGPQSHRARNDTQPQACIITTSIQNHVHVTEDSGTKPDEFVSHDSGAKPDGRPLRCPSP